MKIIIVCFFLFSNISYFRHLFVFFNLDQPISFFMFTIHPTLFSRSVENIFHVSFLIKVSKIEFGIYKQILSIFIGRKS